MYATELRNSTSNLPKDNFKTFGFYNYLIVDGNHLSDILLDDAVEYSPLPNYLLDLFKGCCIYAGKGSNSRKYQHITDAICRLWVCHANSKPLGKTKQIWDMLQTAKGVTVLHLLPDCNHYEAHSREYAIIKALGLVNLSNIYNGTCYGAMTEWNENEVVNFGNMILFNTLKMCLIETPSHVIFSDLIK